MRARIQGAAALVRAAAAAALLVLLAPLAGCVAPPNPSVLGPTPSPTASVMAGVGDEVVLLNCALVVPVDAVAGVLGVTADQIVELPTSLGTTPPYSDNVAVAMAMTARNRAGEHECRYGQAGSGDDGPTVSFSVLPDAAEEFAEVQPDSNDGMGELMPNDLGDTGYSGCRDGEWQGCRAEVLVGQNWLRLSVARPDLDSADFEAYAATVVAAVAPLKLARPSTPPRPECGSLLSPHDLSETAGLDGATGGDVLTLAESGSLATAAEIRGALVRCSWFGQLASGYQGVSLSILPRAGVAFGAMTPAVVFATDTLPAIDLAGEAGARWPASGVEARGLCTADGCDVTLLADGVWLTVATDSTSGATDLEAASALAAAAYTRYASMD